MHREDKPQGWPTQALVNIFSYKNLPENYNSIPGSQSVFEEVCFTWQVDSVLKI